MVFKAEQRIADDYIRAVIEQINDGFLFEKLMKDMLVHFCGTELLPVGEIHDSGIDSFISHSITNKEIFQISIQKDWKQKITRTIDRIKEKRPDLSNYRLTYVCRNPIDTAEIEEAVNGAWKKHNLTLAIWPLSKILQIVNYSLETRRVFLEFCDVHAAYDIIDRQSMKVFGDKQVDKTILFLKHFTEDANDQDHVESLVRTHLFVFLKDTDPERQIFKKWSEIVGFIREQLPNLDAQPIENALRTILAKNGKLHQNDREIRDHGDQGYCASYTVRQKMAS